jgi:hypothetical protein
MNFPQHGEVFYFYGQALITLSKGANFERKKKYLPENKQF